MGSDHGLSALQSHAEAAHSRQQAESIRQQAVLSWVASLLHS